MRLSRGTRDYNLWIRARALTYFGCEIQPQVQNDQRWRESFWNFNQQSTIEFSNNIDYILHIKNWHIEIRRKNKNSERR